VNSLRGNVLRVLVGTILASWAAALIALWFFLKHSETSIADNGLRNFAVHILQAMPANADERGPRPGLSPKPTMLSDDPKLAFQVWADRSRLIAQTPGAPASALKPDFVNGFASLIVDGRRWRVYSVSDAARRKHVQVGRLHSELDAELQQKAFFVLGLLTTVVCLVGLITFLAVRRSLRPVAELQETLRRRVAFDLTPLSTTHLPTELRPLVESFNRVLTQLDEAVENERRFIGDAAHELRTPLAALQAQAHVALHARSAPEKDAALVKLIAVAERNTRLSEQLLDLARLNAGEHAPQRQAAELSELVLHVAREFEIFAQHHQRSLVLDLSPAHLHCNIDEIGILLRNLVDNALRYTPGNGRVRIRCGSVDTASGPAAYLEVADDGPGVPPGEREAIFRRFHRLPGNGGRGSGIGLSLVAGIARLHAATIVTGAGIDGQGFSVRVQFPAVSEAGTDTAA
jgi:signal transduction histidine kinase